MKINVSRNGRFVPEWQGNRELPDSEQIVVEYECLSHDQRRKHTHRDKPTFFLDDIDTKTGAELDKAADEAHARMELKVDTDDEAILRDMKPTIKNLEDLDGAPITTWAQLIAVPQTAENNVMELVTEIMRHCAGAAKDKDLKN